MYLYTFILAIVALARPVGSIPPSFPAHRKFIMKKIQNAYYQIPYYQAPKYDKALAASPSNVPSPFDMTGIVPLDLPGIVPGYKSNRVPITKPAKAPAVAKPVSAPVTKPAPVPAPSLNVPAEVPADAGDSSWKQTVVAKHNAYRTKYGAKPLAWSDKLYPNAVSWANRCNFAHSQAKGAYGENLAAGSGQSYGFLEGLTAWMDEVALYDYNNPTFSSDTGHFTAVIWKSTKEVACALSECPAGTIFGQSSKFIVCHYSPPGNVLGEFLENVGKLLDGLEELGKVVLGPR